MVGGAVRQLLAAMKIRTARALVAGPMPSLILGGTLALAGFGAVALNGSSPSQAGQGTSVTAGVPNDAYARDCRQDPDGDGHLRCVVPQSDMAAFAGGNCSQDSSSPNQICYIDQDGR
jgi:hypothetical protein